MQYLLVDNFISAFPMYVLSWSQKLWYERFRTLMKLIFITNVSPVHFLLTSTTHVFNKTPTKHNVNRKYVPNINDDFFWFLSFLFSRIKNHFCSPRDVRSLLITCSVVLDTFTTKRINHFNIGVQHVVFVYFNTIPVIFIWCKVCFFFSQFIWFMVQ